MRQVKGLVEPKGNVKKDRRQIEEKRSPIVMNFAWLTKGARLTDDELVAGKTKPRDRSVGGHNLKNKDIVTGS